MFFLFTIFCSYWTVSGATDNTHLLEVHNSVVSELTASKMRSGEQVEILNLLLLHIDMQDSFNFYVHVCQSPRNHPICRIAHDCIRNDRVGAGLDFASFHQICWVSDWRDAPKSPLKKEQQNQANQTKAEYPSFSLQNKNRSITYTFYRFFV